MADNFADNPASTIEALQAITIGLDNNLPAGLTQLAAGGQVSTVAALQTEVAGYTAIYQAVPDAADAHNKAIITRDKAAENILARVGEIRAALKATLGRKNPDLTKFGMEPDKDPPPPTVAQKTERVAKALATRAARHTMGPKAKKAIHGTPPTSTPTPAAPVTPAATK